MGAENTNIFNELSEENMELQSIIRNIIYKTDIGLSYSSPVCSVTVSVSPKMYKKLTKLLKTDRGTDKRFIRNIGGQIYDLEKKKFYNDNYLDIPLEDDDDVVKLLNELHKQNSILKDKLNTVSGEYNALNSMLDHIVDEKNRKSSNFL